jgi:hypothetical protein
MRKQNQSKTNQSRKKKSTNDVVNDDILRQTSKTASSSARSTLVLGISSAIIALVAILVYHRQESVRPTQPQQATLLSELFHIGCATSLVSCHDYLLDIDDTHRTIYSKATHKLGSGLKQGWKLLDIPRNVQIWSKRYSLMGMSGHFTVES